MHRSYSNTCSNARVGADLSWWTGEPTTRAALDGYYGELLAVAPEDLWQRVTVTGHRGRLEGYAGFYAAWRGDGVHVSAPPGAEGAAADLASRGPEELCENSARERFAAERGLTVVGPSVHQYRDQPLDPAPPARLVEPTADDLGELRDAVDPADWVESGWPDHPPHVVGLRESRVLVAAANLNLFHGSPRDVGVLVALAARGRGLAAVVARAAAAHAVEHHGFARWGARTSNAASLATARRLGFTPWCGQVAVR